MFVELENSVKININEKKEEKKQEKKEEKKEEREKKEEKDNKETSEISTSINLPNLTNNKVKNDNNKEECVSKYNNYILQRKKELTLDLLLFIGYDSFNDTKYITFHGIQNERVENYIISMLSALKTVFKTYHIRSMNRQHKDKRFCLNMTRQLLQNIGYTLKMKTYPLIRNNIITSSTKYKIVKK